MSKHFVKDFVTDDQRFIFQFSIEINDVGTGFLRLSEVTIFFQKPVPPDNKIQVFNQENCPLNRPIRFSIKDHPDWSNYNLYGEITGLIREGNFFVDGDFHYGLNGQEIHFKGIMCVFYLDK